MSVEPLPTREIAFLLYEVLDVTALTARPRYAEHSRETFDAALELSRRLAAEHFATHNRKSDLNEPHLNNGKVALIPEIKTALDALAQAGLMAAHADESLGGMQLPWAVAQACYAHFHAANVGTFAYAFLTIAAANLLNAFGSETQKARYLRPMLEGRFFGTMALSEPQAGSSLAEVRTRAAPIGEGFYKIKGGKMWTSGGEHELAENIVHMVLARVVGAPPGVKGLSLFIVPRHRVDKGGKIGAANDVKLAGLNHKMGWRGTVNTVMSFGENDDCIGWLVGEPGQGMAQMFHMMNEARIVVGLSAAALACAGFRHSLDYARNRPQGRAAGTKDPNAPPVPIIAHADVKRMLLAQKAYGEGCLALGLYLARLVDEQKTAPEADARSEAHLLLELLTPVMKAWSSDYGLVANAHAIQIHGGYGYTRDFPVEQFYRDNRLNPIHEGTNGIQALDLLGRKVVMQKGAALALFTAAVAQTIADAPASLAGHARDLGRAMDELTALTAALLAPPDTRAAEAVHANASLYLDLFGRIVLAWIWLMQANAAARGPLDDFRRGKLHACRYVFAHELPPIHEQAARLGRFDTTTLDMEDSWF